MRLLDRTATDTEDVRHMTPAELASLGVAILDKVDLTLQCLGCGHIWKPKRSADGALPYDYWICTRTCKSKASRSGR
jgi:hypothetical protein